MGQEAIDGEGNPFHLVKSDDRIVHRPSNRQAIGAHHEAPNAA
jgi:hypothetical protein